MENLKIGCSGWSYQGWVGPFYPEHTKPGDFLRLYSKVFDTVEIDSTFYNIPAEFVISKWFESTDDEFIFCPKMPRQITHENRLRNVDVILEKFLESINKLKHKLGIILIQMPPSFSYDQGSQVLKDFLELLPEENEFAIEFRHSSLFNEDTYKILEKHQVALAWSEVPMVKNPAVLTAKNLYLRLVGDRSIKESEFGKMQKNRDREISHWSGLIGERKDDIEKAYVYSNNHFQGFGPATANQMFRALGLQERNFSRIQEHIQSETGQKTLF